MAETKPMTTALPTGSKEEPNVTPTPRPQPSQAKVDDVREAALGEDEPKKGKKAPAKPDDPYPSQADADAIRDGTFKRRGRQMAPDDKGVEYKTR